MGVGFHALMHPHFPWDLCLPEYFLYIESQCKARWIVAITVTYAWIGVYLLDHSYNVCQGYWKIRYCQWRGISVHRFLWPFLPYMFLFLQKKKKSKQNLRPKTSKSKQPINKGKKYCRSREMSWAASPNRLFSCQSNCYRKAYAWPSHFLFSKHFLLQ